MQHEFTTDYLLQLPTEIRDYLVERSILSHADGVISYSERHSLFLERLFELVTAGLHTIEELYEEIVNYLFHVENIN